jgi:hypothetical protein
MSLLLWWMSQTTRRAMFVDQQHQVMIRATTILTQSIHRIHFIILVIMDTIQAITITFSCNIIQTAINVITGSRPTIDNTSMNLYSRDSFIFTQMEVVSQRL